MGAADPPLTAGPADAGAEMRALMPPTSRNREISLGARVVHMTLSTFVNILWLGVCWSG